MGNDMLGNLMSKKKSEWSNLYYKQTLWVTTWLRTINVVIEKLNWIIRTEQSRTVTTNWTPIDRKNNQEDFAWTLNNGVMRHLHTIALRE